MQAIWKNQRMGMLNIRTHASKPNATSSVTIEDVWTLLEHAKREEEQSNKSVFIWECAFILTFSLSLRTTDSCTN
jgi:hypothetical protein